MTESPLEKGNDEAVGAAMIGTLRPCALLSAISPRKVLAVRFGLCYTMRRFYGAVAQLVEHHVRNVGVRGSNPLRSTIKIE